MIDGVDNSKEHTAEPHPNISRASSNSRIPQAKRDSKGHFLKGVSGNPGGNPNARRTAINEIAAAIEAYRDENGKTYWEAATEIAMKLAKEDGNVSLLCKIMDKFIPTKIESQEENSVEKILPIVKLYADSRN